MQLNQAIKKEQHFKDNRTGEIHEIVFENADVVLLEYCGSHRLERREMFERYVEAGRFKPTDDIKIELEGSQAESEGNDETEEIDFEEISWVGQTSIGSLRNQGYTEPEHFARTDDEKIINQCSGLGEKGLENIKEHIHNE